VKRILAALGLATLLGLIAPACGGGSESSLPAPGPEGEAVIRVEMRNNFFFPSTLTVRAGGDYILELRNEDDEAHNLRIAGIDNEYETGDDLVSDDVAPGKTGSLAFRIDQPGVYDFRSDSQLISMVGSLTVWEAPPIATWVPDGGGRVAHTEPDGGGCVAHTEPDAQPDAEPDGGDRVAHANPDEDPRWRMTWPWSVPLASCSLSWAGTGTWGCVRKK
jgi:plastocyanin